MKKAMKGALLSGLVIPGMGQISLGQKPRGFAFMIVLIMSLGYVISQAIALAQDILKDVQSSGSKVDIDAISMQANQAVMSSDHTYTNMAISIIVICWIASIVDAFIIGKKLDDATSES